MKTADAWLPNYLGALRQSGFPGAADRCIADRGVDPHVILVVDVLTEHPSQMILVEDDYVIVKLAADGADEALRRAGWTSVMPCDVRGVVERLH